MIILFSQPEQQPRETMVLQQLLEAFPALVIHLRKPSVDIHGFDKILKTIDNGFHERIVVHQHHHLADHYGLKGVHLTETDRRTAFRHPKIVSTSFHELHEAQSLADHYSYFFCSPVFPSISKIGYEPDFPWNITTESEDFREKAVALGGISPERLEAVREAGFQHIALLGAVWQADKPETILAKLFRDF